MDRGILVYNLYGMVIIGHMEYFAQWESETDMLGIFFFIIHLAMETS